MPPVEPLTPDRWDDFRDLCRQTGPNRSCGCMWWRDPRGECPRRSAQARAHAVVTDSPRSIGPIAYDDGPPVGWVPVAPRAEYRRLNQGRNTAPPDDQPGVWAIPCSFVVADRRGRGIARTLLHAAVDFACMHGAAAVDGVPTDPATLRRSAPAPETGTVSISRAPPSPSWPAAPRAAAS